MDNLFVVVEEYDHYMFKESKVTYIFFSPIVADVESLVVRITNIVLHRRRR